MPRRFSNTLRCARAFCLPLLMLAGFFQVARAERLPLKPYTVADGLPHNTVHRIVRDSRGFLWFCTEEGLSRFDGYTFTNFGADDGLPHSAVTDFLETRGGELWLGTGAGLVRFNPKGSPSDRIVYADDTRGGDSPMFSAIVPEDEDRRARYITVLLEGHDGTIWAGTRQGVYRLERSDGHLRLRYVEIKWLGDGVGPVIWDLLEDRHGTLWAASLGALSRRWPDGSAAHYTTRDGLPDHQLHDLFEDHRGQLWVGTRGAGFFRFTADETHAPPAVTFTLTVRDLQQSDWINQLFETSDHKLWAATANGLIEFIPDGDDQGRRYRLYTTKNGLSDSGITALNEDMGGNLWLGSYAAGAMKLARDGFISYGEQDGLSSVGAIFGDRTGGVCFKGHVFGDERASVFEGAKPNFPRPLENRHTRYARFDGRSFTWLKPDLLTHVQLGWVEEGVTLQARDGEWWLGTGAGLYRFPATDNFAQLKHARPLAIYTTKDGLTSPQVFRLFEDSRGNIWVSAIGPNGLARWDRAGETWRDFSNAPGLPSPKEDLARSFGEDVAGNVWVGFNGGAARYRDGSFTFFDAKDGLPPGSVMNFHTDRAGHLWLTSARSGLIRVDDPSAERPVFISYTTAEGLSSNSTNAITEDPRGHIYVSTGRGLDWLDPATGRFKHFTTADGLAPGHMMAAFRDRDGVLWFGTWKGLSRLTPGKDVTPSAPPVLITGLTIAGEKQRVSALGETAVALRRLASNENQLQFEFVGLSFAPGEVLRYQYKLAGSNTDWSPPSPQRTVNFASLTPGRYEFLVRAVTSDGVASSAPAMITFTILPPFWRRWWFVLLVALALAVIVYALYRYRVARIFELANVRTRIASDLHDDIGANLTKISILSEVARQQLGNGNGDQNSPLASIARISRESVASMSDIVWAINPQRDSLRDVIRRMRLHAEETCLLHEIELEFDAPEDLDLKLGIETRRGLYLVFKEALNNAARHSGCGRIRVVLSLNRDSLALELTDNGLGFDAASENDGNGLVSMRRRAEALGGKLEIASSAGNGTMLRLQLPYTQSHRFLPIRR